MDIIVPLIIVIVVIGGAVIAEKKKAKNKTAKELIADNLVDKQKPAEEPIGLGASLGLFLCANLFLGWFGSRFCETIFTQCTIYICINIICAGCILAHNLTVIIEKK